MDCVFCKIINNELPSLRVYEDDATLAFLDIAPFAKGHTLVIPRLHVETLPDVPADVLARLIAAVQHTARLLLRGMPCDGLNIFQNNHACANQAVPHVHFHIIPRHIGGTLGWTPNPGLYAPGEAAAVAAKIRGGA